MRSAILSVNAILLGLASLAGAYSGGSGTGEDPYQIATVQDLIDLGQTPDDYGKSFVLTADIDLAGQVFERAVIAPDTVEDGVGLGGLIFTSFDGTAFSGRFDGQGHVIRNLCVDDATWNFQGLFGKLSRGGQITDLGLEGVQVTGASCVGGLVGQNDSGTISSCYSAGTVAGETQVGGLVGENDPGSISLCYSTGTVSGEEKVGGLVGENRSGTIASSHTAAAVKGQEYVGGLAGRNYAGRITSSHSTGAVSGENRVGGLAGDQNSGTITSSYNAGMVSGGKRTGGLAGQNHRGTVSSSHNTGMVNGARQIGGLVGSNTYGTVSSSYSTGRVYGNYHVGGLVGYTYESGTVTSSCNTGPVHGTYNVGGVQGSVFQSAEITSCYSTASVSGGGWCVGGLAGSLFSGGTVSSCYCTGSISGNEDVGGLVGYTYNGSDPNVVFSGTIESSFWDVETSGQTDSEAGGTGLTTQEMLDRSTYLQAAWDFMDETANGTEEIWWMPQGDTPRLWWQHGYAYGPTPTNHASTGTRDLTLQWSSGGPGVQHDVYFGDDETAVADANTQSLDVYCGRLPAETLSYELQGLEPGKTYYWRVDGVGDGDPATVYQGLVWSFTITDYIRVRVLEDFESYDDHCNRIFFTWLDGFGHSGGEEVSGCDVAPYSGNGTGALVGQAEPPYASHVLIHDASQSMPLYYDNTFSPYFSEAERTWPVAQDWTMDDADSLTLYFRGDAENAADPLYILLVDGHGQFATVYHANADAVLSTEAQVWHIPLAELEALGVDVSAIETMVIGVGDLDDPRPSGTGLLYIDDIQLTKRGS